MTTIITVRHAATAHNASRVISGRLDEPLSPEGRAFARQLRDLNVLPEPDRIISSPMARAVETAELISGWPRGQIDLDDRCVERDYGELQGLDFQAVQSYQDRVHYVEVGGIRHSLDPPGGESFEAVRRRAGDFAAAVASEGAVTLLVVTHQVFLQQLHGILLGVGVYAALGYDIRSLQVTEFSAGGSRLIHPGLGAQASW